MSRQARPPLRSAAGHRASLHQLGRLIVLKYKAWSAFVAACSCLFVCHAPAQSIPLAESGYGLYVSSEPHRVYERVGFIGPNITALNSAWVNCPPDFTHWLPWVAYGGSPGGYIWYGVPIRS